MQHLGPSVSYFPFPQLFIVFVLLCSLFNCVDYRKPPASVPEALKYAVSTEPYSADKG